MTTNISSFILTRFRLALSTSFLLCSALVVLGQTTYTFTNCGATGRTGPSQAQVNAEYTSTTLAGAVTSSNGIQVWTVPQSGLYSIEATGAQGAPATASTGGRGARIKGEFLLDAGDILHVVVGQQGEYAPARLYLSSPGGGGSFVIDASANTPLLIAGGGGGTGNQLPANAHGSAATSGNDSEIANTGGSGGNGGTSGTTSAGAGGGYATNGTLSGGAGGNAFVNGALGGIVNATYAPLGGGFGGGGSITSGANSRYGGGGGYSGGGGSNSLSGATTGLWGGGGGSLNTGLNQTNIGGDNFGHGAVVITLLSDPVPNDAGVASINGLPNPLCTGTYPLTATIANYGSNQINPVTLHWSINGGPSSSSVYNSTLDTTNGLGNSTANISLGNVNISGTTTIKAWTSMPNNQNDTVNNNDTTSVTVIPSLSGVYTIGTGGDYNSFSAALTDMNLLGVCGPVTFLVDDGTYNEQISLGPINGMSSVNTVTFKSDPTNNNLAVLTFAPTLSTSNYTIQFSGGSYFIIDSLEINSTGTTYATVLDFPGMTDHITIKNCEINGHQSPTTTSTNIAVIYNASGTGAITEYCLFENNHITGGSYTAYWYGGSTTVLENENHFIGNQITGFYYMGLHNYYQSNQDIIGNHVEDAGTYSTTYHIRRYYVDGGDVIGNTTIANGPGTNYPMYIYYNDASALNPSIIANNFSVCANPLATGVNRAFELYYSSNQHVFHNNFHVEGGSASSEGVRLYFSSSVYAGNQYKNNISKVSGAFASAYLYDSSNGSYLESDYNDFYYPNGVFGYAFGGTYSTLENYQANMLTQDQNSMAVDPLYVSTTDLHVSQVLLNMAATPVGILTDIDGENRAVAPDIGADEFIVPEDDAAAIAFFAPSTPLCNDSSTVSVVIMNTGIENLTSATINWLLNGNPQPGFNWTGNLTPGSFDTVLINTSIPMSNGESIIAWTELPNGVIDINTALDTTSISVIIGLQGTYIIGNSPQADYNSFTDAVSDLHQRGVCASVVFEVEDGVYVEQISIEQINGVSSVNTVTFKSHPANINLAELTYTPSSTLDNYTVQFSGSSYITFDSLKLSSNGTSFATVINFPGSADHITVKNCDIIGAPGTTTSTNISVIYNASVHGVEHCTFENNLISGGGYQVYWWGASTVALEDGNSFIGNRMVDAYYMGLYMYYQSNLNIIGNYIEPNGQYSTTYGIYRYYCDGGDLIGNTVIANGTGTNYAIYIYYNDAQPSDPSIIANNFSSCANAAASGTGSAFYMYYSSFQHMYNNSFNVESSNVTSEAVRLYLSSSVYAGNEFKNNIVATNGSSAVYLYDPSNGGYLTSDHNDFYHPNGTLGYAYTTNYNDLAAYQAGGTGQDMNSISVDPVYVSNVDLHVCEADLQNAGTPTGILDDIDSNNRIGLPDIGADEFMPGGPFDLGPDTIICASNYGIAVNAPFQSILWSVAGFPSSTSNPYQLTTSGAPETYNVNVVVTTEHCGLAYGSQQIKLVPNVEFDSAAHICPGDTLVLDAGGGFQAAYEWFPSGSSAKTRSITQAGIYVATKSEAGCVSSDTIIVTASDSPDLGDMEACEADMPITVDATIDGGTAYAWSGGSSMNDPENELSAAGTYTVTINDVYGCNSEISFDLDVYDEPNAQITLQTISLNAYTFAGSSSTNVGPNAIYAWNFGNNNAVDTGMVVTYIYPYSGAPEPPSYNVQLTIINDCGDDVASLDVTPGLGTMDRQTLTNSVKLYPNPVDDLAVLKFVGKQTNINVNVIDLIGRTVMSIQHPGTDKVELNLDNLASGSYIISVYTDQAANIAIPVVVK